MANTPGTPSPSFSVTQGYPEGLRGVQRGLLVQRRHHEDSIPKRVTRKSRYPSSQKFQNIRPRWKTGLQPPIRSDRKLVVLESPILIAGIWV